MSEPKNTVQLADMKNPGANLPTVTMGFGSSQSFELMQRAAKMLAHSTLVPVAYRVQREIKEYGKVIGYENNDSALPNCVVALNMAQRMGADPLMVMQNLYIVEGRPSWSSQFIIAAINSCGRYSPLRFELSAIGEPKDIEYTATEWVKGTSGKNEKCELRKSIKVSPRTCVAWAIELASGDRLESPVVSMDMAVAEGWIQKNSSKWQTMPEVMLRYRAAAFFGKLYAPELLMGLQTAEEAHDIIDVEQQPNGQYAATTTLNEMRSTGAPDADRQSATDDESEHVEIKEAVPEPADAEQQPAEDAKPEPKEALTPEVSERYEKVAGMLQRAGTLSQLADAADQVGEVGNKELRAQLTVIYKQRLAEFNPPAKEADPATPAKRTRRTGAAGTVE